MSTTGSSSDCHSHDATTSPSLLARVRREDSAAWAELVDLYAPLVASWCRARGLKNEDTADVMQTIFMSVARGLANFRRNEKTDGSRDSQRDGSFRAWLWTITRNRILDHVRRERPDAAAGGSSNARRLSEAVDVSDPEPTSQLDLHHLVHRALEQIESTFAPQTWRAFWRCVIDGQSTDVVAHELDMSAATIRQARSRILRRLREQLGDL